jgi:hypothetical protein
MQFHINPHYLSAGDRLLAKITNFVVRNAKDEADFAPDFRCFSGLYRCHVCFCVWDSRSLLTQHLSSNHGRDLTEKSKEGEEDTPLKQFRRKKKRKKSGDESGEVDENCPVDENGVDENNDDLVVNRNGEEKVSSSSVISNVQLCKESADKNVGESALPKIVDDVEKCSDFRENDVKTSSTEDSQTQAEIESTDVDENIQSISSVVQTDISTVDQKGLSTVDHCDDSIVNQTDEPKVENSVDPVIEPIVEECEDSSIERPEETSVSESEKPIGTSLVDDTKSDKIEKKKQVIRSAKSTPTKTEADVELKRPDRKCKTTTKALMLLTFAEDYDFVDESSEEEEDEAEVDKNEVDKNCVQNESSSSPTSSAVDEDKTETNSIQSEEGETSR